MRLEIEIIYKFYIPFFIQAFEAVEKASESNGDVLHNDDGYMMRTLAKHHVTTYFTVTVRNSQICMCYNHFFFVSLMLKAVQNSICVSTQVLLCYQMNLTLRTNPA